MIACQRCLFIENSLFPSERQCHYRSAVLPAGIFNLEFEILTTERTENADIEPSSHWLIEPLNRHPKLVTCRCLSPFILHHSRFTIYNARMDYRKIITIEPGKRAGKPCIRGMRITVYDVLSYLASGMTHEEILADFPYLTEDDIFACLSYAADREHHLK
jgi:uncharacterized protein (DUF433 family)